MNSSTDRSQTGLSQADPSQADPSRPGVNRLSKRSGVRSRAVARAECLMVFSPADGKIHWLGLTAWLAFELCDGRSIDAIRAAYVGAIGTKLGRDDAQDALDSALASLERSGLIEISLSGDTQEHGRVVSSRSIPNPQGAHA